MVIRMRHTRSHTANRRSHHALKNPNLSVCGNCGAMHRPHHMCLACGFYNGKMVIDMAKRAQDRAARIKATKERRKGDQAEAESTESIAPAETPETK